MSSFKDLGISLDCAKTAVLLMATACIKLVLDYSCRTRTTYFGGPSTHKTGTDESFIRAVLKNACNVNGAFIT